MREIFLTPDLSIWGNFEQLWFLWQKSQTPPRMREIFLTPDLSISGNFKQLWFLWQKSPPPPRWGKFFWHQIYPFQAILSNFGFCGRKAKPHPGWGKFFWHQIYPFQAISSNFGFSGRKAPLRLREHFWHQIYPFQAISSNFGFCGRKAHPRMRENFLTSDLSISGNFEQLWFLWQKSPPPPHQDEGKIFDTRSIHFRQFWATLIFVTEKPPTPMPGWGEIFWHQIYPFQAILSNFGFCDRKAPHPPRMRENFLTPDLSISGNFEQLWFLWQKSPPPPGWGKIFWHQIYPFQAILSNFGFCGRKAPLPLFSLFVRDWARITQVEYPRSPYYKSILRFLLSEYLL